MNPSIFLFSSFFEVSQETILLGMSLDQRWKIPAQRFGFSLNAASENSASENATLELSGYLFLMLRPTLISADGWKWMRQQVKNNSVPEESAMVLVQNAFIFIRSKNAELLREICSAKNEQDAQSVLDKFPKKIAASSGNSGWSSSDFGRSPSNSGQFFSDKFFCIESAQQIASAEKWLLGTLVKDSEGFMSRQVERKISLSITRCVINTRITPNAMTLFSIALGILGAFFFVSGQKWYDIFGALLFWLHSVLDGCDGEIARLKFLESRWGGLLDFWGDNVVHSAIFCGIAVGYASHSSAAFPLAFLAVIGTLGSAFLAYWNTMRCHQSSANAATEPLFKSVTGPHKNSRAIETILDALARRDFIYLVFLLAGLGKIHWFLWMGAIGSPIYFFVLLFLTLKTKVTL